MGDPYIELASASAVLGVGGAIALEFSWFAVAVILWLVAVLLFSGYCWRRFQWQRQRNNHAEQK